MCSLLQVLIYAIYLVELTISDRVGRMVDMQQKLWRRQPGENEILQWHSLWQDIDDVQHDVDVMVRGQSHYFLT